MRGQLGRIVVIDPDVIDEFGHYSHYLKRVETVVPAKWGFTVLGPTTASEGMSAKFADFRPVLSYGSWSLGLTTRMPSEDRLRTFGDAVEAALRADPDFAARTTVLFMYLGSPAALAALLPLVDKYPNLYLRLNFFYSSMPDKDEGQTRRTWLYFVRAAGRNPRVKLFGTTQLLADKLTETFKRPFQALPHPSTTFSDDEVAGMFRQQNGQPPRQAGAGGGMVYFPGGVLYEKGFQTSIKVVQRLDRARYTPTFKVKFRPTTPEPLVKQFDAVKDKVVLLPEVLSDEDFQASLAKAEAIVLPYHATHFADRTSGIYVDCLYLSVPCIVERGTWMSQVGESLGLPPGPARDDIDGYVAEVAAASTGDRQRKIRAAARRYFVDNSWSTLMTAIIGDAALAATQRRAANGAHAAANDRLFDLLNRKAANGSATPAADWRDHVSLDSALSDSARASTGSVGLHLWASGEAGKQVYKWRLGGLPANDYLLVVKAFVHGGALSMRVGAGSPVDVTPNDLSELRFTAGPNAEIELVADSPALRATINKAYIKEAPRFDA